MRWAVVLAGGVGSRFWPVSTGERPKQVLPLAGDQPLVRQAVERLAGLVSPERTLLVTGRALGPALRAALPMLPAANVLEEPFAASTAPALAWATAHAAQQDAAASVLSLHADWFVADGAAFRATAAAALELVEREDVIATVGARPTRPETGYGYIVPGGTLGSARRIARFKEKPTRAEAERLCADGALWNTGLFAWTARRFRAEVELHTPELRDALPHLDRGDPVAFFKAVRPVSIDVGVYERTERGAVVVGDFGWDDVGSWAALLRVRRRDEAGNVAVGPAHLVGTSSSVVWSEDGTTVVYGLDNVVVVRARGISLVTRTDLAPDLKKLLDQLPPDLVGERGA